MDNHYRDGIGSFVMNGRLSVIEQEEVQQEIEESMLQHLDPSKVFEIGDIIPYITEGMNMIVQDDFTKCFRESDSEPWNWNIYLFVLWSIGICIRYFILFPLRLIALSSGFILFAMLIIPLQCFFSSSSSFRKAMERQLLQKLAGAFVFSWTGVVRYHGIIPKRKTNQIYVANHTSMIDFIIMLQTHSFAVVGQQHTGFVKFLQESIVGCLDCIWFDRREQRDREKTAKRIKDYILREDSNRLLIFPEGTCVNNEYCVQFKKGV